MKRGALSGFRPCCDDRVEAIGYARYSSLGREEAVAERHTGYGRPRALVARPCVPCVATCICALCNVCLTPAHPCVRSLLLFFLYFFLLGFIYLSISHPAVSTRNLCPLCASLLRAVSADPRTGHRAMLRSRFQLRLWTRRGYETNTIGSSANPLPRFDDVCRRERTESSD